MYLSTSLGCCLISDRVFLYLPYFPFAFAQFFWGGCYDPKKKSYDRGSWSDSLLWLDDNTFTCDFFFVFAKKEVPQINSTWSFCYHSQIFSVNNLQAMGCLRNIHFMSMLSLFLLCDCSLNITSSCLKICLYAVLYLYPELLLQLNAVLNCFFLWCLNAHNPWWRVCSLRCDSFCDQDLISVLWSQVK